MIKFKKFVCNQFNLIRQQQYSIIDLKSFDFKAEKKVLIDKKYNNQHYDVIIIGGGSGGISFCYESQKLGLKTLLFDYVEKTPQGSQWGIGGTCVNVGCIPKKLFHNAALLKEQLYLAKSYGHDVQSKHFDWNFLTGKVQSYIKSLNFGYKKELALKQIPYINAFAVFKDQNTIVYSPDILTIQKFLGNENYSDENKLGIVKFIYKKGTITADKIVIATGGKPTYLQDSQCKNIEQYSITSDDLFSLKKEPGKTLVIGGGYIALECSGFLGTLGFPVSIMTRGVYLRSMDRQVVDQITSNIQKQHHVNIIPTSLPYEIIKLENQKYNVKWQNMEDQNLKGEDEFDTILTAVGRSGNTKKLNIQKLNMKINQSNNKIIGGHDNELEKTSVKNVYAIGDVLEGIPELTPVAMKMAINLAQRFHAQKQNQSQHFIDKTQIKYDESVPTTVFTPLEYGFIGLTEEQALKKFGNNIEIYLSKLTPLEEQLSMSDEDGTLRVQKSFFKIICNKNMNEQVIGLHYLGPHAGEIIQGFAVAFNMGMKKEDLDRTIGIHPTIAEEFIQLKTTQKSKLPYEKTGC